MWSSHRADASLACHMLGSIADEPKQILLQSTGPHIVGMFASIGKSISSHFGQNEKDSIAETLGILDTVPDREMSRMLVSSSSVQLWSELTFTRHQSYTSISRV